MSKKIIRVIADLVIRLKNSNNYKSEAKRKVGSNKKYCNCHKFEHYAQNCNILNKKLYQKNQDKG